MAQRARSLALKDMKSRVKSKNKDSEVISVMESANSNKEETPVILKQPIAPTEFAPVPSIDMDVDDAFLEDDMTKEIDTEMESPKPQFDGPRLPLQKTTNPEKKRVSFDSKVEERQYVKQKTANPAYSGKSTAPPPAKRQKLDTEVPKNLLKEVEASPPKPLALIDNIPDFVKSGAKYAGSQLLWLFGAVVLAVGKGAVQNWHNNKMASRNGNPQLFMDQQGYYSTNQIQSPAPTSYPPSTPSTGSRFV